MQLSTIERYLRSNPATINQHVKDSSSYSSTIWTAMYLQEFKNWIGQLSELLRVGILPSPFLLISSDVRMAFDGLLHFSMPAVAHVAKSDTFSNTNCRCRRCAFRATLAINKPDVHWLRLTTEWRRNSIPSAKGSYMLLIGMCYVEAICTRILFDLWSMACNSLLKLKRC